MREVSRISPPSIYEGVQCKMHSCKSHMLDRPSTRIAGGRVDEICGRIPSKPD